MQLRGLRCGDTFRLRQPVDARAVGKNPESSVPLCSIWPCASSSRGVVGLFDGRKLSFKLKLFAVLVTLTTRHASPAVLQVLEGWLQWSAMGVLLRYDLTQAVVAMITQLADLLHSAGKVGVLAMLMHYWQKLHALWRALSAAGNLSG